MLINIHTIPAWIIQATKLPIQLFVSKGGTNFSYCIRTAMLEDIEWQQDLELGVDKPLLIERKWYRIWFKKGNHGYFNSCIPDSLCERLVLKTRFRCIYKRLQKNGDHRKEFVRIMVRALNC